MALALISEVRPDAQGVSVRFDIGKNTYLRWQLGEQETVSRNGLPQLAQVHKRSSLIGPIKPESLGRGEFRIPSTELDRDWRWLQILSYREADGTGPAISAVENIPLSFFHRDVSGNSERIRELPPPAGFATGYTQTAASARINMVSSETQGVSPFLTEQQRRNLAMNANTVSQQTTVDNVPFNLRERQLSEPMFLQAIVGALPSLLPMLGSAVSSFLPALAPAIGQIGNLIGGRRQTGTQDPGQKTAVSQIGNLADQAIRALGPSLQQLLTPENIRNIMQLIQAGQNASAAAPATTPARTATPAAPAAAVSQSLSRYSEAQVAPALLAALPALMPLLQQVLSPQTVQSVIQAPERMTGQVINGIKDFARLGLEADQQLQQHLERLNPGVDDPLLHQLLASMSLEMGSSRAPQYKRVSSVRIHLDELQTQVLFGREQTVYSHAHALQFPISVETPQSISDAQVHLQIKQAKNLRVVYDTREPVGNVDAGPLGLIPRIEASVTQSLDPQKEHIVVLTLLWKNSKGQWRGTSVQHTFLLIQSYRFDRVEESGELIPLSDRQMYRDYWHQIWETNFDSDTRRVDIQSRYYLTLDTQRTRNARIDSELKSEVQGPRKRIRLRSGYEYSLYGLNHLMRRLTSEAPSLGDDVLQALDNEDFLERFHQAAQHQAEFKGRPGEHAEYWVYPEFKLQTLVLVKAQDINEHGNVVALGEERVRFPLPAMLHFIGVYTQ